MQYGTVLDLVKMYGQGLSFIYLYKLLHRERFRKETLLFEAVLHVSTTVINIHTDVAGS